MPKHGTLVLWRPIPGIPGDYNGPAVYVLTAPSGEVYVGSSVKIRERLNTQRNDKRKGWVPRVAVYGDYTKPQLRRMEAEAIRRLRAAGYKVANVAYAGKEAHTPAMQARQGPSPKRPQYTIDGLTAPMGFWLATFGAGVSFELALARINRLGWEPKRAFSTPPRA